MRESIQVAYCKNLFYTKGRNEKLKLLEESNLTDKEIKLLKLRYIEGLSIKEASEEMKIEIEAFNKLQKKVFIKFYTYLTDTKNI